jgi:hypothetical protein
VQELKDELKLIRESQIRMEADLQYHIKRTDLLERKVEKVEVMSAPMPTKEKLQIGAFIAAIITALTSLLKQLGI